MNDTNQPTRRAFLKGLVTTAVASSAAASTAASEQLDPQPLDVAKKPTTKYQETQHVKDYYDSL